MGAWYCTREDVASALDVAETARNARQLDRNIESASRSIDAQMHRVFYPTKATRTFDWPDQYRPGPSWTLWLDDQELAAATALVSGGTTISASDYFLRPDSGPPYDRVEIDLGSSAAFSAGTSTWQQSISITGTWAGCRLDTDPAGTLNGSIDSSQTSLAVTDSAAVGVGSILLIGSEYLIVTRKSMLDTGQNLGGSGLTAVSSDVIVPVTTGTSFALDEVILIGAEQMKIVDIAGNNLIVKRAWNGTVLAAHAAAGDIYAPRTCTVERGSLGSTAASHGDTATIVTHRVPGLIHALGIAEAIVGEQRESSGYARTVNAGEAGQRAAPIRDLTDLRAQAFAAHGRQLRIRSV